MAKIKTFKTSRGVSLERNGVYHKFLCEIEIELSDGDDFKKQKKKAWNTVEKELERKIENLND